MNVMKKFINSKYFTCSKNKIFEGYTGVILKIKNSWKVNNNFELFYSVNKLKVTLNKT